jgi:hypothetical protein
MFSKKISLLLCLVVASVSAQITYDEEFWEGFDNEKPYEH